MALPVAFRHHGVAIGIAKNSPPPCNAARLFPVDPWPTTTPELPRLPRPAIVFGGLPCERMASAVSAQRDVVYVAVVADPEEARGKEQWVDSLVVEPRHHEEICEAGTRALERKRLEYRPRAVVGERIFAWRGEVAELSQLEARIMRRLLRSAGSVVPKEELAYELWGVRGCDPGRAVDTHIYRIRRRIAHMRGVAIETARQRGFRLVLEHPGA